MCDEAEGGSVALDLSLLLFCFKGNLGQNHLAAKMEWKRHLITGKGEMGELWGKKAVGDQRSILIKNLIKFITDRIKDLANIL